MDTHKIGDTADCWICGVPACVHWRDAEHLVIEPGAVARIISLINEEPVLAHGSDAKHPDAVQKILRVDHMGDRVHFICVGVGGTFLANCTWGGYEVPHDKWDSLTRKMKSE